MKFIFTAPGDDGELGIASEYEILSSYDISDLMNSNRDEIKNKSLEIDIVSSSFDREFSVLKPKQGGFLEYFLLNVSSYDVSKTFSIKIRAIDPAGNVGKWSWPLTIKMEEGIELSPQLRHYKTANANLLVSSDGKKMQNDKPFSKFFIGFLSIYFCLQKSK